MAKYKDAIKKQSKSSLNHNKERQKKKPDQQTFSGLSNSNKLKEEGDVRDYPQPFWGGALVLLGAIGCILTSPLLILGWLAGAMVGLLTKEDVVESGLFGANLGSLGFLSIVRFGLELGKGLQTSNQPEAASLNSEQEQSADHEVSTKDLSLNTKARAVKKTLNAAADPKVTTDPSKKSESADKKKSESADKKKSESADNKKSESADKKKSESADKKKSESADNKKSESADNKKSESADNKKSESVDKKKSDPPVKSKQEQTSEKFPPEKSGTGKHRLIYPVELNSPAKITAFLQQIHELIIQAEAKPMPKKVSDLSQVKEPFILKLISIIKDPTASPQDFWERMEQMSDKDIHNFVNKLSSDKEGKYSSSELDYLWRRFKGTEFEPSAKERKKEYFAVVLSALSENQLSASFNSPDFLNILNQDEYRDAMVNTMTSRQLELFAADNQRHTLLEQMIKKLKADDFILGKLVAIMPLATRGLKQSLIDQLSHLPYPPSFKTKLCKLADHYIEINNQALAATNVTDMTQPNLTKPISKWTTVIANVKPVYANTKLVEKEKWSDEVFDNFIQQLNSPSYLLNQKELIDTLGNMPDDRVKMMVEKASSIQCKDLLNHLWVIESKPNNQGSYITGRKHRLKIVLEHLTEEQLKESIKENKFWDIFRNTQQPHCKMAAKVLTPEQFKMIISNATLERHCDFATLITLIKKDSPKEQQRLIDIIKEILPHTTPWFALALEMKIKDLLVINKVLFNESNAALKQHLSESMKQEDVKLKYKMDMTLDKKAISTLVIDVADPAKGKEQPPTFRI